MTSQASFYDIHNIVLTPKKDFCHKNEIIHIYEDKKLIKQYIINNNIKFGDIIYIGGNGDRLEYYFGIVIEDGNFLTGEQGPYIIFDNNTVLQKIKDLNISYDNAFKEIKNDEFFADLFFGYEYDYDEYNSIIQKYDENNLI